MATPKKKQGSAFAPEIRILPQYHPGGDSENELRLFVVENAPDRLRPESYDVYGAVVSQGLSPYSIAWYPKFFESILGDSSAVYANAKKMYSDKYTSLQTNFYFTNVNRFLDQFTNIREVSDAFLDRLKKISIDEPIIVTDVEKAQYYHFLYTYALTTRRKSSLPCGEYLVNGRTAVFCKESSVKEITDRKSPLKYIVRPVSIRPGFESDLERFAESRVSAYPAPGSLKTVTIVGPGGEKTFRSKNS